MLKYAILFFFLLVLAGGVMATTVTLKGVGNENLMDVEIRSDTPATNEEGDQATLTASDGSDNRSILIKWNVTSLSGQLIDNALLRLQFDINLLDAGDYYNISAHKVFINYTWDSSTVVWNTKPNVSRDYNSTIYDSIKFTDSSAVDTYHAWNITDMVSQSIAEGNLSVLLQIIDSGGTVALTDFLTIRMSESSLSVRPELVVTYHSADVTYPQFSGLANNASAPKLGDVINFSAGFSDDVALDYYVFAHNQSGTMTNVSTVDISGTSYNATETLQIITDIGTEICGQYTFNDTSGNVNQTGVTCLTVEQPDIFWSLNKTNNSFPRLNDSITFNVTWNGGFLNYSLFEWNCSSLGFKNLSVQNAFTGISTYTYTLNYTSNIATCSWRQYVNNSLGYWNYTDYQEITIKKLKPNATPLMINKPYEGDANLNGTISFEDIEGDTWQQNETRWYNGSKYLPQYDDLMWLSSTNTTVGETWYFSARVYDGFNWSDWRNDSVTIGDTVPPKILSLDISPSSVTTDQTITYSATLSDASSSFNSDACKFSLRKADYDGGNGVGIKFNLTTTSITDSTVSFNTGANQYGTGTLYWDSAFCFDASNNEVSNLTVSKNIVISSPSTPPTGGGGGGGAECTEDEDCLSYGVSFFCVNSKCIKLTREDIGYNNLKAREIPQVIIDQLIVIGEGLCNWDGICELDQGENQFNCGNEGFVFEGDNIAIDGDCTGLGFNIPSGFLTTVGVIAIILLIIVISSRRKTK